MSHDQPGSGFITKLALLGRRAKIAEAMMLAPADWPVFEPHSPQSNAIANLFGSTLWICGGIFLLVTALIAFCSIRFREQTQTAPAQLEGNRRLEIGWTLVPIAILAWLLLLTSRAMAVSDPPVDRTPDLTIIAHQWWWEVRYPSGAVTANEIHIPAGKPLVVRVESADVVHDFWVPSLGRKIDAIPGRPVEIWLQANEPGLYLGTCAEFCGAQHAWMRIQVIAESPEQFARWEAHQQTLAPTPVSDAAQRGAALFAAKTCQQCHAVSGISTAEIGPELTHLAERATLGAGVLENTPAELALWLKDPQRIKPGSHMPSAQLTDPEVGDLVAWFETLR